MSERITELRDAVAAHTGAARARPLVELGQALLDRYWRTGPGTPAGKPGLDEAIGVLREAYDLLGPDSPLHGQLAGQLGWLYGTRHTAHGGPVSDRETGITLLEEALRFPRQPPVPLGMARFVLGQLLLARQMPALQAPDLAMRLMAGGAVGDSADLDRAVTVLREIIDGPPLSAELTDAARTMLAVAEAWRSMFGGAGRMDIGKMIGAMSAVQDFQGRMRVSGADIGLVPEAVDVSLIPDAGPAGRPVAVVDGPIPEPSRRYPPGPRRSPEARTDAPALRDALTELLGGPVPEALRVLLDAGTVDVATVDHLAAIGSELAESPDARPSDHLAFAAALHLRGVTDETDRRRAVAALSAATANAPAESPEFLGTALRLATPLDRNGDLDESLAEVTVALREAGVGALLFTTTRETLVLTASTGRLRPRDPADGVHRRVLIVGAELVEENCVASYVRSAAQVTELVRRGRRPAADAVFVANPRRDRDASTMDALLLRRWFYPRSTGLGRTVEGVDGAGTPDEVLAHLGASVLHLGCGVTPAGALELAEGAELPAELITAPAAGVVVLPPDPTGTGILIDALLAGGAVDVIAFREPVPASVASVVYFLLHAKLVDEGLEPAVAVDAVRRWMRDPARAVPERLPATYRPVLDGFDLTDPRLWRSLVCHGI